MNITKTNKNIMKKDSKIILNHIHFYHLNIGLSLNINIAKNKKKVVENKFPYDPVPLTVMVELIIADN